MEETYNIENLSIPTLFDPFNDEEQNIITEPLFDFQSNINIIDDNQTEHRDYVIEMIKNLYAYLDNTYESISENILFDVTIVEKITRNDGNIYKYKVTIGIDKRLIVDPLELTAIKFKLLHNIKENNLLE